MWSIHFTAVNKVLEVTRLLRLDHWNVFYQLDKLIPRKKPTMIPTRFLTFLERNVIYRIEHSDSRTCDRRYTTFLWWWSRLVTLCRICSHDPNPHNTVQHFPWAQSAMEENWMEWKCRRRATSSCADEDVIHTHDRSCRKWWSPEAFGRLSPED